MKKKILFTFLACYLFNNNVKAADIVDLDSLNNAIREGKESNINIEKDLILDSNIENQTAQDLVIDGGNHSLDGQGQYSGFWVDGDKNLTVLNLGSSTGDITSSVKNFLNSDDYDGGCVISFGSDGKLTVKNSTFYNNISTDKFKGHGAAISTFSNDSNFKSEVYIDNSYFIQNKSHSGSAIGGSVKILDINKSVFKDNSTVDTSSSGAGRGGAIYVFSDIEKSPDSHLKITNTNFENNKSYFYGGAIYAIDIANIDISKGTFKNNTSSNSYGGAGYLEDISFINIDNSEFNKNTSVRGGGALYVNDTDDIYPQINIKNSKFISNQTEQKGGALNVMGNMDIIGSEFDGNISQNSTGGAIFYSNISGKLNISDTTFTNNQADSYGGAISVYESDKTNIINSTFKNNSGSNGGALYITANESVIVDTDFIGNTATGNGGAIYTDAETLSIAADNKNVLFSQNTASENPSDIYLDWGNKLNLTAAESKKLEFNGTIYADEGTSKEININDTVSYTSADGSSHSVAGKGEVQFNNFVENLNVNLYGGMLSIGQNNEVNSSASESDGYLNTSTFNIKGDSILNTVNNVIGEFKPIEFNVEHGVNWEYRFDIDLESEKSDKLVNLNENKGNLRLGLLNIIKDTNKNEVEVKYSDTNIEGVLKDDYQVTTSTKTYQIEAKNDESGSSLVIKQDSSAYGLAGAVEYSSDVYSNTSDSDEIVEHWLGPEQHDNELKEDLVVNANDKGIVAGQDNIDGLVTDGHNLDVNNAQDFSGFNVAVDNNGEGTVTLKDSNFTGNTGDAAVKNKNGEIDIQASDKDVLFDNPDCNNEIVSDGGSVNVEGGNSVTFEGNLQGSNDANLNLNAGNVNFNGEVSGFDTTQDSGNVNIDEFSDADYTLKDGNLNVKDETNFNAENFTLEGGNLNTSNGKTGDLTADNFNLNGNVNMSVDVDLANEQMDRLTSASSEYTDGEINVNQFNVFSDTTKSNVRVNFTDDTTLKDHVSTDVTNVYGPIYNYAVSYDPENGDFLFNGGGSNASGYNPAIMASPIAAQLGGYLTQLNSYDEAFRNMDMYMLMTKAQRNALKFKNKYAAADSDLIYDPIISKNESNTAWFRPYTTFENVPLKNGQKVSNVAYGSFFGAESPMYDLGHGWDGIFSLYAGYNGSHQAYDGVSIYQNGGTFGVVGMAYKDNFFTGLTANIGSNVGEANTMYGNEDFTMLLSGVASKSGYNIEFKEGKYIVQPNLILSYSLVNTFDYTNAAGIRINADPLHAIQVEPGAKFIANLNNGWQPYLGVSFVYNILDKTNFTANDVALPELSIKPFVKYGVGVRKSWGKRFVGYLQSFITNGGRNGIGIQTGLRIYLGK